MFPFLVIILSLSQAQQNALVASQHAALMDVFTAAGEMIAWASRKRTRHRRFLSKLLLIVDCWQKND
jgi:Mn2+/Fe2+ NRAMP family transporter